MASSGEVPYLVRVRFTSRFGFRVKVSYYVMVKFSYWVRVIATTEWGLG